jgi:glycosyltransferase involved in cell wall biosynthesis
LIGLLASYLSMKCRQAVVAHDRFHDTLTSLGEALIFTDTQCRVTFINPMAQTMTGRGPSEAEGKPLGEVLSLIHEDKKGAVEDPAALHVVEGPRQVVAEALGLPIVNLEVGRRMYGPSGVRGFARLVHLIHDLEPDIVHGYLFGPNLFAALAGRWCRVPAVVVAKRNVDAFESARQIAAQRIAHRLATHVTAVSAAVGKSAEALGVPRARITVIPNGVDTVRFAPAGDAGRGTNGHPLVIGSVGCLAARKDYATLLDALALLVARGRTFDAVLIGDGPERARLEARARALGLEARVKFVGERPDVERWLPTMDVFALSSREEGIPNALLEAMAAGLAAVATAVGGTPEVMRDRETGWLVPAGSPESLACALDEALTQPDERSRRGSAARRDAVERLSIDAMVHAHEEFYARVASAGGSR